MYHVVISIAGEADQPGAELQLATFGEGHDAVEAVNDAIARLRRQLVDLNIEGLGSP